jgi:hypothetical protein
MRLITPPFLGSTSTGGAVTVAGTVATIAFSVGTGSVRQDQRVFGTAATIAFSTGTGTVRQYQRIFGTPATLAFSVGAGQIEHSASAPVTITGTPATIAFSVGAGAVRQDQRITGSAATVAFSVGTGTVRQDMRILGTPAEITWTPGTGEILQAETITGTAAEITFSVGTGVITQTSAITGGRLIRSRRSKHIYWDEDEELGKLVTLLGRHPIERDKRTLRAEAKLGLTDVIMSGHPVHVSHDDNGMLLELVGQQIRVAGALQKHVEQLLDDEDAADLLQMIL